MLKYIWNIQSHKQFFRAKNSNKKLKLNKSRQNDFRRDYNIKKLFLIYQCHKLF